MLLRITSRLEAHAACEEGVTHLISIQNPDANLAGLCPDTIAPDNHLVLLFEDVDDPEFPDGPTEEHLQTLFAWLRALDPNELRGLLVHCDAGVSRSTATAWLALLLLEPETPAADHLERVAQCSGREFCWPSNLVTALADRILNRDDSLVDILLTWKNSQQEREA